MAVALMKSETEIPFANVPLARLSSSGRLSDRQALGYHMLLRDRERAAGRSGCTVTKIGQPLNKGASASANLWWNSHAERHQKILDALRPHERAVVQWVFEHSGHNASPNLPAIGKKWSGYRDDKAATAAAVSRIQMTGDTLAHLYQIRAP